MVNLTEKSILEVIPEKGIPIRSIFKKFGIPPKKEDVNAKKLARLLKKLEKKGRIRKENKSYYLISQTETQKILGDFTETKSKSKTVVLEESKKKKITEVTPKSKKTVKPKAKPSEIKTIKPKSEIKPNGKSKPESIVKHKPKTKPKSKLKQDKVEKVKEKIKPKKKKVVKPSKKPKKEEAPKKSEPLEKPASISIISKENTLPKSKLTTNKVELDKKPSKKIKKSKNKNEKEKAKKKMVVKELEKQPLSSEVEISENELSEGVIRQGSIAEFMRKRTQLVGFDIGLHKHTQFCAEFLDNALDGIESFNWKFPNVYKLKKLLDAEQIEYIKQKYRTITKETSKIEYELTRKAIIDGFKQFIEPVKEIISKEPLAIIRIREIEKPKMLPEEMHGRDIRMFCFEALDSGIGLVPSDLQKFGLYLASSKSANLKQTRGSQGFGASSAFSDSQNTTGRPITVITRHQTAQNAYMSVFYTTSKNHKEYALKPDSFRTNMQHGTYIRLFYLNVRYIRGYADEYIRQASFLNGHITLIFIDPYGDVHIYPRGVNNFPGEPKYAQPHPASVLIGEFQDLLRSSNQKDIVSFLSKSFVRMSKKHAKEIVEKTNSILGAAQNLLTISPSEISETNIRALYRNLTRAVVCLKKTSPENILKFIQTFENKPIIKVVPHFYDYSKEKLIPILKNLDIEKKKSNEITIEDIKNIQEAYKDVIYCPFSTSFARFNSFLKENPATIEKILSKRFCNLNSNTIKKLILKTEELLKIRNLYVLNAEELTKKELKVLYEAITKNISDFELSLNELDSLLKESKGKSLITTLKKLKGIGAKTLETILEECNAQLEYKNLANTPANEMTTKAQKVLFVEMNSLEKCPSSITLNKFSEMLKNSKNKNLSSFISQNFAVLSKKEIDEIIISTNESLGGAESLELIKPSDLNEEQMNTLFRIFSSEKYLAPPTDTVVPVGSENLIKVIDKNFEPAFVEAETRRPTSGKGLAFGVEVAIAYGGKIKEAGRATDVLSRFVNRTPKLRDNSDCAIWKAVCQVNWKNYKLDTFDNGIPRGKVRIIVNVSGPFVHVMFKSQSKQALADDETLTREIQLALEEVGRKLRSYLLKKEKKKKRARRASQLLKHVKYFSESLYNILKTDQEFREKISSETIEKMMIGPIAKDIREDILTIMTTHWTPFEEILEDLGLNTLREKWIITDLIIPIMNNMVKQNIILKETREEVIEEGSNEEESER
ncbi:MAG: hypothetical protein ACTSR3_20125, partial [Candidatus Helarchaeota archaeon]